MSREAIDFTVSLAMSGERFQVVYTIIGSNETARATAEDICIEQTIEFPPDLVTGGDIREHIFGRIESIDEIEPGRWETVISFASETVGSELTQLLNVVFGNTSLKPGIRVERLELSPSILENIAGPRFGIQGVRELLGVPERPLLCTSLKPMGLPPGKLAEMAHQMALGGVDLIKDDHGLTDQPFAPFELRVDRCAEAVARAVRETGKSCIYCPNVTAPVHRILKRASLAKERGAGGIMVAPGLTGPDTLRMLAVDDRLNLPIVSHPAFLGTYSASPENGLSHHVLYGQLPRLFGADMVIYPNYGGRFPFSRDDCRSIVRGATEPLHHIKPVFSVPGGGMNIARIPEMLATYGRDVIFLVGGAMHKQGPDLITNCRQYMAAIG